MTDTYTENRWYVYILQCADASLYTGITTDPQRRINEHNNDKKGARYTRSRRPVRLVYLEAVIDRAMAAQREASIKSLVRAQKLDLIRQHNPVPDFAS